MSGVAILQVEHLRQVYQSKNGETVALQDIHFSMEKGEFYSMVGPSGCGKSTLLSIIAGTLTPEEIEQLSGLLAKMKTRATDYMADR